MSDRFYQQQLKTLGDCPGNQKPKKGRRNMAWTDEKKAAVVAAYQAAEPTAENSIEIVNEIAEEYEESPNGVRMILTKAEVYIKKAPAAKASPSGEKAASTRVSKQGAQDALVEAIEAAGRPVDMDVISKLTGKAAQYFTTVIGTDTEAE